jgi:type III pantothenate kinase
MASVNREGEAAVEAWISSAGLALYRVPADVPYPLPVRVETPERVGPDRVLACAAAVERFGGPCIVVDAGTASTVDLVDAVDGFRGGAILAGRHLLAEALHVHTSALPRIEPDPVDDPVGTSTEGAIRAGTFLGWVGGLREVVTRMMNVVPGCTVVLTGGDARFLAGRLGIDAQIREELVLDGIRLALEKHLAP